VNVQQPSLPLDDPGSYRTEEVPPYEFEAWCKRQESEGRHVASFGYSMKAHAWICTTFKLPPKNSTNSC
jgi:hypothetical protein